MRAGRDGGESGRSGDRRSPLKDLALLFLRLGATAFGGPAAHIAMMEQEVVRRRGWLSEEEFLDLLGATSVIPGPSSTEMAIYVGRMRGGLAGVLVAGACFILPAAVIVTAIAWAYVRFGALPEVSGVLYGVKPVVIAVVLQALWNLRAAAVKTKLLMAIGIDRGGCRRQRGDRNAGRRHRRRRLRRPLLELLAHLVGR